MIERWLQMAKQLAARHGDSKGIRSFQAATSGGRGQLYVYEMIGLDWWTGEGLTAKRVADALDAMKGVQALDIFINSPGGDIFEAKAIHSLLRRFEGERVVHVDGIAASAATLIAMAGDKIITAPAATWMVHEVWARGSGRSADFRALADTLDKENAIFADLYAKRTGQPVEKVLGWMAAETWMNATEAKERGFTDEIAEDTAELEAVAAMLNAMQGLRAHAA